MICTAYSQMFQKFIYIYEKEKANRVKCSRMRTLEKEHMNVLCAVVIFDTFL